MSTFMDGVEHGRREGREEGFKEALQIVDRLLEVETKRRKEATEACVVRYLRNQVKSLTTLVVK